MLYHASYNPAENKRYILAYNEKKHGLPRVVTSQHIIFLYRGAVNVSAVYSTASEALKKEWGKWSKKPVIMPDGREVVPAYFFGRKNNYDDVFIPWACVRGEKWPGEV